MNKVKTKDENRAHKLGKLSKQGHDVIVKFHEDLLLEIKDLSDIMLGYALGKGDSEHPEYASKYNITLQEYYVKEKLFDNFKKFVYKDAKDQIDWLEKEVAAAREKRKPYGSSKQPKAEDKPKPSKVVSFQ